MGERTRWAWLTGTFFAVGYLRPGPGTYGSVAAVLLWLAAARGLKGTQAQLAFGTGIAAFVVTVVGIRAATIVARESGREDPGFVVIDEVAGQLIALLGLPAGWPFALLGLLLFRAFDIAKPWPIRRLEALHGGTGIMLDDVAAGAIACVCAHLVIHFAGVAR